MRSQKTTKVVVAMSGGVDSSVAAALLKRAGFNLIGVFMRFWQAPAENGVGGKWNRCCSPEAEKRARRVAQIFDIPFYVFNFEKEFKKRIVDYFLAEYKAGRTPNPCVVCNKEIKFGLLLEKALGLNADFIATGHYVRKRYSFVRSDKTVTKNLDNYQLLKAKDKTKDQSYFLWQLKQKQLRRILFPIGDYTKKEVRALAEKFKLPVAEIKESQEVCFIKKTTEDFLKRYLKEKKGPIVERVGYGVDKTIGEHKGLWFYTIGQRKGIGLSGGPYYVLNKDKKKNTLVVTKKKSDLAKKELIAKDVNWVTAKEPIYGSSTPIDRFKAKIRYNSPLSSAVVKKQDNRYKVIFKKSQLAVTPGQSVVFYKGNELLGGGIIA